MGERYQLMPDTDRLLYVGVDKLPKLKPTDILVFSVPEHLTDDQSRFLNSKIKQLLADNKIDNRFMVLGPTWKLNVIRLKLQ